MKKTLGSIKKVGGLKSGKTSYKNFVLKRSSPKLSTKIAAPRTSKTKMSGISIY